VLHSDCSRDWRFGCSSAVLLQVKRAGLRLHRRDGRALTPWESGPATVSVSMATNRSSAVPELDLWQLADPDPDQQVRPRGETGAGTSRTDRLIALIEEEGVELFHDQSCEAFARVPVGNHKEVLRCRSRGFRGWLAKLFWEREGKVPRLEPPNPTMSVIMAKALYGGDKHTLHNRVARQDRVLWLDLADEEWRAVKVTDTGWSVVSSPPTLFRRYSHQQPLPEPSGGGDLRGLLDFVNLSDESQRLLLMVYVVSCLIPDIPHPILVLSGPQGSAKTTLLRMLRRLVDPSELEELSFPRREDELIQQLSHHWVSCYDNMSSIPTAMSDVLCRAVTGLGYSKRELYTDDDDVIYRFRRCIAMNGINVVAQEPDLLDRSIVLALRSIPPEERKPEGELMEGFEAKRPLLIGGILDALSCAMELRESVTMARLPRMADFALWGCAIAEALGYSSDEFASAYECNAKARNEEALQASPVAAMVAELMEHRREWEGTATELLEALIPLAQRHSVSTKAAGWPRAPHVLRRRLNEVLPNLAAVGIEIVPSRDARKRTVTILKSS